MILESLFSPEFNILGLYIPWVVPVVLVGFLSASVVVNWMERLGWTRFIWHLPLFLLALAVFFSSLVGLVCSP